MKLSELIGCIEDDYQTLPATDRASFKALALARAEQLNAKSSVRDIIKAQDNAIKNVQAQPYAEMGLKCTDGGIPKNTIENFFAIMQNDDYYSCIRYNSLTNTPEIHMNNEVTRWTNSDISASREYIESKYNIYSKDKHKDALQMLFKQREYNPIMNIINKLEWDGVPRMEELLIKYAGCEDSLYSREVSRLIFAGGMWRLMLPGCKFDDVPVLVGKQGSGKSSLVRLIALNDTFFGEVKTTDGDAKSIEQLSGKWILEIPELAAFNKSKEVESIKAFITRQRDMYRTPYAEMVEDRPRRCMFIGTTNNPNFLVDLSGNRRFYPIKTQSIGYDLYDKEDEIRDYIKMCWAEAKVKYELGDLPPYARRDLLAEYEKAQANSMQDDWRIGAIYSYLTSKGIGHKVCVKDICTDVIYADNEHATVQARDSKDVGIIMTHMTDWERLPSTYRSNRYGMQRGWVRTKGEVDREVAPVEGGEEGDMPF